MELLYKEFQQRLDYDDFQDWKRNQKREDGNDMRKREEIFYSHNIVSAHLESDDIFDKDSYSSLTIKDEGCTDWKIRVEINGEIHEFDNPENVQFEWRGNAERDTFGEMFKFASMFLKEQMDIYDEEKRKHEEEFDIYCEEQEKQHLQENNDSIMKYSDLPRGMKLSFSSSLQKVLKDKLHTMEYALEKVTDEFINDLLNDLKEKGEHTRQKWTTYNFDMENDDDVKKLVFQKVNKMRKRSATEKQLAFYQGLLDDLQLDEKIPSDYFKFSYSLKRLKQLNAERKPATEKQIKYAKKLWENAFGEELEIKENISRKEISEIIRKAEKEYA